MKKLFLALSAVLILSACNLKVSESPSTEPVETMPGIEVNNFEDCVAAGNLVMESYPRQCRHGDTTFVEEIEVETDTEIVCNDIYKAVCGEVEVQCIKAPCPPLKTTFSNECEAKKAGAINIQEGACQDETINPEGACLSFDGNWLAESNECEGMAKEMCEELGGTYNECASACRNDPDAEMCTMQCILVCQF